MTMTKDKTEKPDVVWDTYKIWRSEVEHCMERAEEDGEPITEDEAERQANEHTDHEFYWDDMLECLGELLEKVRKATGIDGNGWSASVENFGWRGVSGSQVLDTDDAGEFLQNILPDCECTFKIFNRGNHIAIQNFHHDSPVGNEWYYIYPVCICEYCENVAVVSEPVYQEQMCQYHYEQELYRQDSKAR